MKRLLREPLVHFLLIGAALFAVSGFVGKRADTAPGAIVITRGQIASLASGFTRTWQRPPTADELEGLIQDRVREEVYYREATALGLDKDDTIIRRRLRQKMEFVSEDVAAQAEPTDAELDTYLREHPDAFRVEPRFTFRQVYLSQEKHGADLARDAAGMLASLTKARPGAEASRFGDPFLLGNAFDDVPAGEVAKQFGESFAARLAEVTPGRWQGPIESGYGLHLVFVASRTDASVPELATIHDAVRREWVNAKRLEANEAFYRGVLKKYNVTIDRP
jgi:hypothetical protein